VVVDEYCVGWIGRDKGVLWPCSFYRGRSFHLSKLLTKLKSLKCSYCYAVNLSPSDVLSKGEGVDSLIAEKIGNIGYTIIHLIALFGI